MKYQPFRKLIGTFAAAAFTLGLTVCATQTSNAADTNTERALLSAGFKARPATTAEQRHHLRAMPEDRFTVVKQGGETYYLYVDKREGRLYAGNHWAYRAFINNEKNNELRRQGALVFEKDPSNRADNRTVVIWHDWSPFQQWR
jgi:hypothetical protein